MKSAKFAYSERYLEYLNFIEDCKLKDYTDQVTHKHHILPKFSNYEVKNDLDNLIVLSVEDHATAHLLLSKIWPKNTYEWAANMWAFNMLSREKNYNELHEIKESRKGELNPFFGKKHSEETKKLLSKKTIQFLSNLSYEDRYSTRSINEKRKRSEGVKRHWDNISETEKKKRGSKISNSLKGKMIGSKNGFSKKCTFQNKEYGSIADLKRETGLSDYLIKKDKTFKLL